MYVPCSVESHMMPRLEHLRIFISIEGPQTKLLANPKGPKSFLYYSIVDVGTSGTKLGSPVQASK